MRKSNQLSGARLAFGLALIGAALVASDAAALTWPNAGPYFCRYRLADGTEDTSRVSFKDLAGNNHLRRGRMITEYPRQGWESRDKQVTITKGEDLPGVPPIPDLFTRFELTINDPPNDIQCKNFIVFRGSNRLYYGCDNGVQQVCYRLGDPGTVRPPDLPPKH